MRYLLILCLVLVGCSEQVDLRENNKPTGEFYAYNDNYYGSEHFYWIKFYEKIEEIDGYVKVKLMPYPYYNWDEVWVPKEAIFEYDDFDLYKPLKTPIEKNKRVLKEKYNER